MRFKDKTELVALSDDDAGITTKSSDNGDYWFKLSSLATYMISKVFPTQGGNNGKFLQTNGTIASWETVADELPSQTSNSGKSLITNGTTASWSATTGLRNKLINANPLINQRAYVSGVATTIANQYTLDRWRVVTSGQNLTFSTTAGIVTMTAPAGGVEQVVESLPIGTYVINWEGTATATVNGTARNKGETFTISSYADCTVKFSSGTVIKPQLEEGTVATVFEHRPSGIEYGLCLRYYWKPACSGGSTTPSFYLGVSPTNQQPRGSVHFPVRMRTQSYAVSGTFVTSSGDLLTTVGAWLRGDDFVALYNIGTPWTVGAWIRVDNLIVDAEI